MARRNRSNAIHTGNCSRVDEYAFNVVPPMLQARVPGWQKKHSQHVVYSVPRRQVCQKTGDLPKQVFGKHRAMRGCPRGLRVDWSRRLAVVAWHRRWRWRQTQWNGSPGHGRKQRVLKHRNVFNQNRFWSTTRR